MKKKGENVSTFKERYFRQSGDGLYYFKTPPAKKANNKAALGFIDLSTVTKVLATSATVVELVTPDRTFILQTFAKTNITAIEYARAVKHYLKATRSLRNSRSGSSFSSTSSSSSSRRRCGCFFC